MALVSSSFLTYALKLTEYAAVFLCYGSKLAEDVTLGQLPELSHCIFFGLCLRLSFCSAIALLFQGFLWLFFERGQLLPSLMQWGREMSSPCWLPGLALRWLCSLFFLSIPLLFFQQHE